MKKQVRPLSEWINFIKTQDSLLKLYTATTKHPHISFGDYCKIMHSFNEEQKHIEMFNWVMV